MGRAQEKTPLVVSRPGEPNEDAITDLTLPDSSDTEVANESSIWKVTDTRQKFLLAYIFIVDFWTILCTSVPSPFLARIVVTKGGTILQSAIVLQGLMLALAISCIFFGKYQPKIGCKQLFVVGLGLLGLCQIAMGFLQFINDGTVFVCVGAVIRILQGTAEGALSVSSLTILCQEYPNHISIVFGITEAAVGAGYLTGPVIGGALFDVYGMILPMVSSGGIALLFVPLSFILLKTYNVSNNSDNCFNVVEWIFEPKVILVLCSVATVFGGIGFYDTAMTIYVENLGFTATNAGLVLFSIGLSYGIGAIVSGYLAGINNWIRVSIMAVGFIGFALIGLIFAPHQSTAIVYVGGSLVGILTAFCCIPSFEVLVSIQDEGNLDEEKKFARQSVISGAWYFAIGLGMFALSIIGSALNSSFRSFSFAVMCTVCSGFLFSVLLFALTLSVKRLRSSN